MPEKKGVSQRTYNFWLLIKPAEDLAGQWTAHVLDVDVVTYGTSITDAFNMALEAAQLVVDDDLERNADPLARRAPDEHFAELYRLLSISEPVSWTELRKREANGVVPCMAAQIEVHSSSKAEAAPAAPVERRTREPGPPLYSKRTSAAPPPPSMHA